MTMILIFLVNIFVIIPSKVEEEFNDSLKTKNLNKIEEGW